MPALKKLWKLCNDNVHQIFFTHEFTLIYLIFFRKFPTFRNSCFFFKLQNHASQPRNIFFRTAQGAASLSLLCLRFCLGIDLGRVTPMIYSLLSREFTSLVLLAVFWLIWTFVENRCNKGEQDWNWTNFLHGSWLCTARINFSPMFLNVVYGVQRLRQHPRAWDM